MYDHQMSNATTSREESNVEETNAEEKNAEQKHANFLNIFETFSLILIKLPDLESLSCLILTDEFSL